MRDSNRSRLVFTLVMALVFTAGISCEQFKQNQTKSHNEIVKLYLKMFHHSCAFFWAQNEPETHCTREILAEYGYEFKVPPAVVVDGGGDIGSFSATGYHVKGGPDFSIDSKGIIQEMEADDASGSTG